MKKRVNKNHKTAVKKQNSIIKNLNFFHRFLDKKEKKAEKWMIERRKFFIKLIWTIIFIVILLVVSNYFS